MITIQAVRVVRDFSHATIYFTVMAGEMGKPETTGSKRCSSILSP